METFQIRSPNFNECISIADILENPLHYDRFTIVNIRVKEEYRCTGIVSSLIYLLLEKNPEIRIAISHVNSDTHSFWKRFPHENYSAAYTPPEVTREFNTGCISYVVRNNKYFKKKMNINYIF